MALNVNDTKFLDIAEIICEEGLSGIDKAVQIIINGAMLIERDRHLKAQRYERTPERVSYANGFKPKQLNQGLENYNYPSLKPVMANSTHHFLSRVYAQNVL